MTSRNGSDRKKKPKRKRRRSGWGVIDEICMNEQELHGGTRRVRTGGGWWVLKKPLPK